MPDTVTVEEFHARMRDLWSKRGFEIPGGERIGVLVEELVELSADRNAEIESPHLDLWVAILDEHISWFISLYTVVWGERDLDTPATNLERAVIVILARAVADKTAIRHLVLAGFDTSARSILRSLVEYLEVFVAIVHKPEFADQFVASDTPDNANHFWATHIRRGALQKRVKAAWEDFIEGADDEGMAKHLSEWGRGSNRILSGLAHPSIMGGLFSAIPFRSSYSDQDWHGIFGLKAEASVNTIYYLLLYMFPIFVLNREFPFGDRLPLGIRTYDDGNDFHRHVKIGSSILASVILGLASDTKAAHIFPDIDMSIWPDDKSEN
jgi:hypothetical protein